MNDKSVKIKRTESLLMELIPEALSAMGDSRIKSITITDVVCSRGKSDATVYIYETNISEKEKREIISQLIKVSSRIKSYCLASTGWYKCPNFTFEFDTNIDKISRMEELFAKIKPKEQEENNES